MFGALRLILAFLIIIEHLKFFEYHLGATALMGFYMLSGYVTAYAFERHFSGERRDVMKFYADRMMRIYPSYVLAVIIITGFFAIALPERSSISISKFALNILLLPLNFHMFIGHENLAMVSNNMPVPYAKSLALILEFYLIAPLIMIFFKRRIWLLAVPSVLVFALASTGVIDSYIYGYILMPGTLYVFLIGTLLYFIRSGQDVTLNFRTLAAILLLLGFWAVYLFVNDEFGRPHVLEVMAGAFIFPPIIYGLSFLRRDYKADAIMGALSYPVFILQWFSLWLVTYAYMQFDIPQLRDKIIFSIVSSLVCLFVSAAVFLPFEAMVQGMRRKLKRRAGYGQEEA